MRICGIGVHPHEEQNHIDALHKEEEEELYNNINLGYAPPKYETTDYTSVEDEAYQVPSLKTETHDVNEVRKLTREVNTINGAMNDMSDTTMKEIRQIKDEISEIHVNFSDHIEALNEAQ